MKRDEFRSGGGDLHQNLEELGADPHIFDTGLHGLPPETRAPHRSDSAKAAPDREPTRPTFVDATDDPNLHITRRMGQLEPMPQEGDEALEHKPKPGFHEDRRPMEPLRDQGPILHPRSRERAG